MTTGGWFMLALLVGGMTILLGWCIHRVLNEPSATKKLHSQADIDTHDHE